MTRQAKWRLLNFWPSELAKTEGKLSFYETMKEQYLKMDDKQQLEFMTKLFGVEGKKKEGE